MYDVNGNQAGSNAVSVKMLIGTEKWHQMVLVEVNFATNHFDEYMQVALSEARTGAQKGEVPVGAVLVDERGGLVAADHNRPIELNDPTAHAEILVLRSAAKKAMNYRLLNTSLVVTIEPCVMCMGAIIHARVQRIVFGAVDHKWGAVGSLYNFAQNKRFNHQPEIIAGVCEEECRSILQNFFKAKRGK